MNRSSISQLRPGQPAPVHRADGDLAVEGAEADEVLEDVGAGQHAVDPRVVEGDEQPFEHRPPVDHRPRLAGHADHPPRRVVGGDDEQRPVGGQPLAARAVGERLGDPFGSVDAHRREGGVGGIVETTHGRVSAVLQHLVDLALGRHGVGTHQPPGDDRPGGVGVLDDSSRWPAGEQAVHERPAEGVAGAEPADDLDRPRRDDRALVGRGDEHAVAAELDDRNVDAAPEQGVGGLVGHRRCRRRPGTRRGCRWRRRRRSIAAPMTADASASLDHNIAR